MAEREEISRGLGSGESLRSIARRLARAPSTVSREVARHGGRARYRANHADYEASVSALRPKPCRLALNGRLRKVVASKLALEWSPEQISGWLKIRYPDDESMQISHETIYKSLFIQARGVLKKELIKHLRTGRRFRHARQERQRGAARQDPRDDLDSRASRRGRGQSHSRSLGGGFAVRYEEQPDHHAGRASLALHRLDQSCRPQDRERCSCSDAPCAYACPSRCGDP